MIGAAPVKTGIAPFRTRTAANWQSWNYAGPTSAFSNAGDTPIPCYGGGPAVPGTTTTTLGCTAWANAPAAIWQTCSAAAVAPYGNYNVQWHERVIRSNSLLLR